MIERDMEIVVASGGFEAIFTLRGRRRRMLRACAALVFAGALSVSLAGQSGQASTQTTPAGAPGTSPQTGKTQAGTADSSTTVLILTGKAHCGLGNTPRPECRLNDHLFVGFSNLKAWMAANPERVRDVALVLNERVMRGIRSSGPDDDYMFLEFDLKRLEDDQSVSKDNRDDWNALLRDIREDHQLHIRVAAAGGPPYLGPEAIVPFRILPGYGRMIVVLLVLMILLGGFLILALQSDIVRDSPSVGTVRQSYSLARCQMAWWFFLIAASYCYIWLLLDNRDSLTAGALILTGISAGTGLAATVIDVGKRQQRDQLEQERSALNAWLTAPPPPAAGAPAPTPQQLAADRDEKTKRLAQVETDLAALPTPVGASEGFFKDILRDETGISFHRFQMMAWTVVLGVVFLSSVWRSFTMPDFSATLLGLMGISSGTYVGFKLSSAPK